MTSFDHTVRCILPELLLIAAACGQFLLGPFFVNQNGTTSRSSARLWSVVSIAALIAAFVVWQRYPAPLPQTLGPFPMFKSDPFAWFFRGVAFAAGLILVLINWDEIADEFSAEFHGLVLLIVAGTSLTAAANDLAVLFLSLELVSIPTYVFLYLPRRQGNAPEATTKYFLLSIFSSAIVLYGFSFLYGAAGTTQLAAIHQALALAPGRTAPSILLIAAACIVAGLSFRVTAVPFHFYAPDVFQGSHAGAGALLAFVPKIVGFAALYRILHVTLPVTDFVPASEDFRLWCDSLFWLMAVASMILGNVVALLQRNIKRLLAYSSVAHAGYMLVGLAIGTRPSAVTGIAALLFYLVAYAVTIAGVFGLLVLLRRHDRPVETIDDLAGLSQTHPAAAAALMVLLFSLTGLPPTAGFLGKLNLLIAAWSQGTTSSEVLAIVLALNAAIAAAYYLRIVGMMYLRPPAEEVESSGRLPAIVGIAFCVVVSVGLFFFPGFLWSLVDQFST